jgi:signal transduction histidine kinase
MLVDGLLVLLTAAVAHASLVGWISQVGSSDDGPIHFAEADVRGVALLLLGTLPLLWRRRGPVPVFVISSTSFFFYEALRYAPPPLPFAPLIALYTIAAARTFFASAASVGGMLLGLIAIAVMQNGLITDDKFLAYFMSMVAAWMLGYGLQVNRARTAQAEEATARLASEQAGRTQLAVRQEQRRIARELHDIVAHNVCLIVAQAAAAGRVWDAEPEQARRALGSVEQIGREAIAEMRLLLHVLGTDDGGGIERAPQPRLDRLPALVAQIEQAGLPVRLVVQGQPRTLPAAVELSAYRIVQEALTNSLKHAGPARAEVVLHYRPDALGLRIRDSGSGDPNGVVPGQGMVGMRQRATLLGGTLAAAPQPAGGFLVTAELPVNPTPKLALNGERSWESRSLSPTTSRS